jgi:hypothetical protein
MEKNKIKSAALLLLTVLALAFNACINEDLSGCDKPPVAADLIVRLQIHWTEHDSMSIPKKGMLINLQSLHATPSYGRDLLEGPDFIRHIRLPEKTFHLALCYNYYDCESILFREEDTHEVEAFLCEARRSSYERLILRGIAPDEPLVVQPEPFYAAAVNPFEMTRANALSDTIRLDMYPDSLSHEFTFCIRHADGLHYLAGNGVRAAVSGMGGACSLTQQPHRTHKPSTVLIDEMETGLYEGRGQLHGRFRAFAPVQGCRQHFSVETLSKGGSYDYTFWDVSSQIAEAMTDRAAKLARDGYDILITESHGNMRPIPPPPPVVVEPGGEHKDNGGFDPDVSEWGDESYEL